MLAQLSKCGNNRYCYIFVVVAAFIIIFDGYCYVHKKAKVDPYLKVIREQKAQRTKMNPYVKLIPTQDEYPSLFVERQQDNMPFVASNPSLIAPEASLVILIPFTQNHSSKVVTTLSRWSEIGDPCPFVRNNIKTVDLVFWFNLAYDETELSFSSSFVRDVKQALGENIDCFGKVKFLSANLKPDEDVYPIGPSYQFYKAFLSNIGDLTGQYDYMFWHEHDVYPIRPGFIDKIFEEVTFHGDFYFKGSIHRGTLLDPTAEEGYDYIEHINGNALYNFHDPNFVQLLREILLLSQSQRALGGWYFAMDTGLWRFCVTNHVTIWRRYQQFAHKFVHSDFIQSFSDGLSEEKIDYIRRSSSNTFLYHGDRSSTGLRDSLWKDDKGGVLPLPADGSSGVMTPQTQLVVPPRSVAAKGEVMLISNTRPSLVIILPFFEQQMTDVSRTLTNWLAAGDACSYVRKHNESTVDLLLWYSHTFSSKVHQLHNEFKELIKAALGHHAFCFRKVHFVIDTLATFTTDAAFGKSYQLYSAFEHWGGKYDYMFWHDLDVYPIREGFIDKLYQEITFSSEFYMKGSIHRGYLIKPKREKKKMDSCRRNMNALYNFKDKRFRNLVAELRGDVHDRLEITFEMALQRYLKNYRLNWHFIQHNAHKFSYTDIIHPGGKRLSVGEIKSMLNGSATYLVQGQR